MIGKANLDFYAKGGEYVLNQDFGERQMFDATCAECGQQTQVPFQPSGDRPVYCRDCFSKRKPARTGGGFGGGSRQLFDAVCADCGQQTQVPFQPSGERPVYCRDCFSKRRA